MSQWQQIFIIIYLLFSISGFLVGFANSKKGNTHGNAHIYNLIGAFVWADAVIFGLFWSGFSALIWFLEDWKLFLLAQSVFWLIRSVGEMIYWLNQQFSDKDKNPIKGFWFYKYFKNDSVWFVWQIYWQCLAVIFAILTIFFSKQWLTT